MRRSTMVGFFVRLKRLVFRERQSARSIVLCSEAWGIERRSPTPEENAKFEKTLAHLEQVEAECDGDLEKIRDRIWREGQPLQDAVDAAEERWQNRATKS
jgi:hypothetical protein